MKNLLTTKTALTIIIFLIGAVILAATLFLTKDDNKTNQTKSDSSQTAQVESFTKTEYTEADLAQYDGTDPDMPIYIGFNGKVYDVTAGKDYYQTGGSYHYLAGRDSSVELNQIGGDIIVKKYPVIGILIK